MRFQFRYCSDGTVIFWYGDTRTDESCWQLSPKQLQVLSVLRPGVKDRHDLRHAVMGKGMTPSERAAWCRLMRRLCDQGLVDGSQSFARYSLTDTGRQVHDDLAEAKCETLSGKVHHSRLPSTAALTGQ